MNLENRLSTCLFRTKRLKVLEFLVDNPEKEFTISEIKEMTGASKPTIIKFVGELSSLGIVKKEKKGSAYLVSLNPCSPYTTHLRKILELDTEPLIEASKKLKEEILKKKKEKVDSIVLFGSVARGTPKLTSDVDILVLLSSKATEGDKNEILGTSRKLREKFGVRYSLTIMKRKEFRLSFERGDEFPRHVKRDCKILYGEGKWRKIIGEKE